MRPGVLLAGGKYRIENELGAGGWSTVYAARDTILERAIAIKLLQASVSAVPDTEERLLREARAVAKLESDHIVRILDTGTTDEGQLFIVMERLEGRDLQDELSRAGKLPHAEAVHYVLQACEALAHAHRAGIIHRDIKPSNMFLARRPNGQRILKLLDFGIARASIGGSITHAGVLGTPQYMSPEQMRDARSVDGRSDIWALGITLFQLLTGTFPFQGKTMNDIVTAVFETDPPRLAALGIDVPEGLEAAMRKCLAREREERFADVLDLAEALFPFAPLDAQTLRDGIIAIMHDVQPRSIHRGPVEGAPTDLDPPMLPAKAPAEQPITLPLAPKPEAPVTVAQATLVQPAPLPASPSSASMSPPVVPASASGLAVARALPAHPPRRTLPLAIGLAISALVVAASAIVVVRARQPKPELEPTPLVATAPPVPSSAPIVATAEPSAPAPKDSAAPPSSSIAKKAAPRGPSVPRTTKSDPKEENLPEELRGRK